ncbi:MAG: pyrimidine-nucleoside phosphorylase [Bacillota bacterium]|nr:pyrimidine-nucleoside phosphorylase [Bacillota bacterium]MDD3298269.1 pyrimidine-nucleoside phosphorylase [Bacillota bacterium]MDD3851392.1 pyrimidine-nucleoside phosphorylase [Bacillota bacterium]MDD4707812.1 pyrimidine-nucleoside phosphorylase [Bacillota bacterium]
MRMYDIIKKKRDDGVLEYQEIKYFIDGYVEGNIPDYQAAAFLMAVFIRGMSPRETVMLTQCIRESGEQISLSAIPGIKVDKHSTGGVGDKTSIVLAPLVAAAGIPVAKMSGRGLGHTGGTIDKLESIPGFKAELTSEKFISSIRTIGVAITGQTGNIAPGDKKLYALRDVTATIDNISLIASSIMSKKLAGGADRILLDVKVGSGAFMKEFKDAIHLARTMVHIGNSSGKRTIAVISDMSQPLGYAVGNALEVREAIDTVKGEGPEDFYELCRELGAVMLMLGEKAKDLVQGRQMIDEIIYSGRAAEKIKEFIGNQGGDPDVLEYPDSILPKAKEQVVVKADKGGYILSLDAEKIGIGAMLLGAGRSKKEDVIDPAVGIMMNKKAGMPVKNGEAVATLHINNKENLEQAVELVRSAVTVAEGPVQKPVLIKEIVE